jgi:hypothetical protein
MRDEVLYRRATRSSAGSGWSLARRCRGTWILTSASAWWWRADHLRSNTAMVVIPQEFQVEPGQAGRDEPTDRPHRGVNTGEVPYEEVTVFFLDAPEAVPQPPIE